MAVQIYQNEELNDIMFQVEALDEWKELASSLGLDKQTDFLQSAESPIPYPYINTSMEITFKTLCPRIVNFKQYDKTPIPLEVLKQIALSVNDNHFQEIQIWYDDKTPDPFAIGVSERYYVYNSRYNRMKDENGKDVLFTSKVQAKNYAETIGFDFNGVGNTDRKLYLIARWADELRPLNELKNLAKERLIDSIGAELKVNLENTTQALKKLTENAARYIAGDITESELKGTSRF
jgi:hypothetical protein